VIPLDIINTLAAKEKEKRLEQFDFIILKDFSKKKTKISNLFFLFII
jgi:hypothetical protein